MPGIMTVHILCPECLRHHAIADWPHDDAPMDVLFTCLAKWGGCGHKALVHVSQVPTSVEDVFLTGEPLTAKQAAMLSEHH
jgi:hypothetical protein